jgi:dTDP-4-amino-4,6-dideoxygalactose transaminase
MTCFSFHPVKTIAMGEGGAVTTNDPLLCKRLKQLRNHGMTRDPAEFTQSEQSHDSQGLPNPWYYEMHAPGFNYRASDINCALGLSQLQRLEALAAKRCSIVASYDRLFSPFPDSIRPVPRVPDCDPVLHLYALLIDWSQHADAERARVMRSLLARRIGTQVHYLPVHRQPYYRGRYGEQMRPGADEYYRRALSIPLYATMREPDVERVVSALAEELGVVA